ncbi:MAG: DUF1998 domain-containing protein [Clostridiales bacterium]|jgi:predicted RNA-binding Zn-ribbon protein involved in translation (DUF1610 family)|nr:DUF1998 domain-containing protein [Clostridiales bacterium]
MGRLKARVNGEPQFIITSATLGDGSDESNKRVVTFAEHLTGCHFTTDNIITAYREQFAVRGMPNTYPNQLYIDLANSTANEENFFADTIKKYAVEYDKGLTDEAEILYDILVKSDSYAQMRGLGSLIDFNEFSHKLGFNKETAVGFISLCAKARKGGKALVDIRYHYFLRALDGCYLAFDDAKSLSLIRKEYSTAARTDRMFEVGVCDDCGEVAIVGKTVCGRLERVSGYDDETEYYQVKSDACVDDDTNENQEQETPSAGNKKKNQHSGEYVLCKSCGAIIAVEEGHNKWCECGDNRPIRIIRLQKPKCKICDGDIRRFNLGFEAATGVIATSLYEHIPEYSFKEEENAAPQKSNPFIKINQKKKQKEATGSQFLVFSDSRQGAAKFACFLEDAYKEFLRRRGIWNVADNESDTYLNGINFSDFIKLLENYFSEKKLFRDSNDPNATSSIVENRRNSWIALLNELHNSSRRTSLVSLGKLQFDYMGNNTEICGMVAENYGLTLRDAKAFLDCLVFEIVKAGAIVTDKDTDINDEDRKYLYFSQMQKSVTKNKDIGLKYASPWLPTAFQKKDGTTSYYRSNKFIKTMAVLKLDTVAAIEFLDNYFEYLKSDENKYHLTTKDGKQYYLPAGHFIVKIGKNATLWRCNKCGDITQFNICGHCIQSGCDGDLMRLDSDKYCAENYYATLYKNARVAPLFIKEHTAQLAKKEALEYQQQFIRKEINALSCSTTFEMGVDVGDLETVFLRNIPPLPSNYAQRVGRAGRSIDAAAFALTFARLSSHDFTFFDCPKDMINGVIYPPQFELENEKIIKRHVYAVALSLYLRNNPDLYDGNKATKFINEKGYERFFEWLEDKPTELLDLLKNSFKSLKQYSVKNLNAQKLIDSISTFEWVDGLCGADGILSNLISEFEDNVRYLEKEYEKAMKTRNETIAIIFKRKLERYTKNDLIDMLVRGNILPKYGFPIDSVELSQNISSPSFKSLNLSRDLAVAIAEYAPSSEVVADGGLYTSRYIKKPFVNHKEFDNFDISYIAECPKCNNTNYRTMPVGNESVDCAICGEKLKPFDFRKSIEPRAGFVAEKDVQPVPLSSQDRKYKTEAIYIGDKNAYPIEKYKYMLGKVDIEVESTANDSLVVKSTNAFYVCPKCGYSIADDETSKLFKYEDYKRGAGRIEKGNRKTIEHDTPFGKGKCDCVALERHLLHHEFKTDVAKIMFGCNTSDEDTMLSVMYALLNSFANTLSIERRDIKACLTYKRMAGVMAHKIIIYDAVPGGAGHSRRLVTEDGEILKRVIRNALALLNGCSCEPSCYKCLRNYENQKIHERLDRQKAIQFLEQLLHE